MSEFSQNDSNLTIALTMEISQDWNDPARFASKINGLMSDGLPGAKAERTSRILAATVAAGITLAWIVFLCTAIASFFVGSSH